MFLMQGLCLFRLRFFFDFFGGFGDEEGGGEWGGDEEGEEWVWD